MRKLMTGAAIAAALAMACAPIMAAVPQSKAGDALYILLNPARGDANWAATTLRTFITENPDAAPPTPAPTPVPTPTPSPTPTPPPAPSGTRIASQAALTTALADVKGGKTLLLASGSYAVAISGKAYAAELIITSADPKARARITSVKISKSGKVTLRGLEIGRSATVANRESQFMVNIDDGSDIKIDGNYIHGSLDDDPRNDGIGIKGWLTRAEITNNEFTQLGRAATLSGNFITVRGNRVHDIRSEGFQFANARDVLIEANRIERWKRASDDHPDAIQWFTNGTNAASARITIRGNIILCNIGDGAQGIFMRDETKKLPFADVTIENNFVLGKNMANGIYVDGGRNVTVRGNTVISPTDDGNPVWISLSNISGLTSAGNIADSGGQKTPAQAFSAAQLGLLKTAAVAGATPAALVVAGAGYQPK